MPPQDLRSLRGVVRRLSLVIAGIAVLMGTVGAGITLVLGRADEDAADLTRTQLMLLTLDELNESLRGDILAIGSGQPVETDRTQSELQELRDTAEVADLSALPLRLQTDVNAILVTEQEYADGVAKTLGEKGPSLTEHVQDALATVDPMIGRLDRAYTELTRLSTDQAAAADRLEQRLLIAIVVAAVASGLALIVMVRRSLLGSMTSALTELKTGYEDQERVARIGRALDQTETEFDVYSVVSRAAGAVLVDESARLLISDASEVHLDQTAAYGDVSGCCDVAATTACPAIRGGRPIHMPSSIELDACPRLRDRPGDAVSAMCTPVTFLGKALGVVQVLGPEGRPTTERTARAVGDLAHLTGARIGTMRSLALAQRQATVDPLTGLLNRRTLEDRARKLALSGKTYAVAMLDLDHFKNLNDTYGHEVGDRALKMFAQLLRDTLRTEDVVARYGGEEFVVVFPDTDARTAVEALMHVRSALALTVAQSGTAFTFSGGVTDSTTSDDWRHLVRDADAGLMAGKEAGRDRIILSELLDVERRTREAPTP